MINKILFNRYVHSRKTVRCFKISQLKKCLYHNINIEKTTNVSNNINYIKYSKPHMYDIRRYITIEKYSYLFVILVNYYSYYYNINNNNIIVLNQLNTTCVWTSEYLKHLSAHGMSVLI